MKHTPYLCLFLLLAVLIIGINTPLFADSNQISLKGDLRLRHQFEKTGGSKERSRQRIRFRLSGKSQLSKQNVAHFGLATGSDDPRSTNHTLGNAFHTPDIRLDYAFVSHRLSDHTILWGGKMKNPLFRPSDLLWDSDIMPEGASVKFHRNQNWGTFFLIGSYFIIDELKTNTQDPYLVAIQPGFEWDVNSNTKAKTYLGLYLSGHVKGTVLDHSAGSNTLKNGALPNEFSCLVFSAQLDFKNQFRLELIRPFGEYVINTSVSKSHQGAIAGVKFGNKKVKSFGKWQSKVSYRYLNSDAWFDALPDSDAYGGATNSKGLEVALKYGLAKNTSLNLDIYNMDKISGPSQKQTVIQVDIQYSL